MGRCHHAKRARTAAALAPLAGALLACAEAPHAALLGTWRLDPAATTAREDSGTPAAAPGEDRFVAAFWALALRSGGLLIADDAVHVVALAGDRALGGPDGVAATMRYEPADIEGHEIALWLRPREGSRSRLVVELRGDTLRIPLAHPPGQPGGALVFRRQ